MLVVIALWVVLVTGYGYATVSAKLALPPSPELYTNSAGFQALSFVFAKVPALVVLLFTVLGFQVLFLHAQPPPTISLSGRRLMRRTLYLGIAVICALLMWFMFTTDVQYNPWFQYDEQLVLHFLKTRLPIYAVVLALVLSGELWWLRSRAS